MMPDYEIVVIGQILPGGAIAPTTTTTRSRKKA
jgi:hypothetical protein